MLSNHKHMLHCYIYMLYVCIINTQIWRNVVCAVLLKAKPSVWLKGGMSVDAVSHFILRMPWCYHVPHTYTWYVCTRTPLFNWYVTTKPNSGLWPSRSMKMMICDTFYSLWHTSEILFVFCDDVIILTVPHTACTCVKNAALAWPQNCPHWNPELKQ